MLSAEEREAMVAAAGDGRLREQLRAARRARPGSFELEALLAFLTSPNRVLAPGAAQPRTRRSEGGRFLL